MKRELSRWVVGLSIAAASIVEAKPARAQVQYYAFQNHVNQNYCLGIAGHSANKGSNLVISPCNYWTYLDQNWIALSKSDSTYLAPPWNFVAAQIVNDTTSGYGAMCIATASNGSRANGTQAITWTASTKSVDQYWTLSPNYEYPGCYHLVSWAWDNVDKYLHPVSNSRVLGVAGGNNNVTKAGTSVILYDFQTVAQGGENQIWCAVPAYYSPIIY